LERRQVPAHLTATVWRHHTDIVLQTPQRPTYKRGFFQLSMIGHRVVESFLLKSPLPIWNMICIGQNLKTLEADPMNSDQVQGN
jgi:hypothetical protein